MHFFCLWNSSKDNLKNVSNQTDSVPIDIRCFCLIVFWPYNGSHGVPKRLVYQHSAIHVLTCSTEQRKSYRFGVRFGRENYDYKYKCIL